MQFGSEKLFHFRTVSPPVTLKYIEFNLLLYPADKRRARTSTLPVKRDHFFIVMLPEWVYIKMGASVASRH